MTTRRPPNSVNSNLFPPFLLLVVKPTPQTKDEHTPHVRISRMAQHRFREYIVPLHTNNPDDVRRGLKEGYCKAVTVLGVERTYSALGTIQRNIYPINGEQRLVHVIVVGVMGKHVPNWDLEERTIRNMLNVKENEKLKYTAIYTPTSQQMQEMKILKTAIGAERKAASTVSSGTSDLKEQRENANKMAFAQRNDSSSVHESLTHDDSVSTQLKKPDDISAQSLKLAELEVKKLEIQERRAEREALEREKKESEREKKESMVRKKESVVRKKIGWLFEENLISEELFELRSNLRTEHVRELFDYVDQNKTFMTTYQKQATRKRKSDDTQDEENEESDSKKARIE